MTAAEARARTNKVIEDKRAEELTEIQRKIPLQIDAAINAGDSMTTITIPNYFDKQTVLQYYKDNGYSIKENCRSGNIVQYTISW